MHVQNNEVRFMPALEPKKNQRFWYFNITPTLKCHGELMAQVAYGNIKSSSV